MHLFRFPETAEELLKYLRSLPGNDPQYLLDAYTQSLSLVGDDSYSLLIFLDYINLSMGFLETDEVEHLYNLFKVKLRKYKVFWISYIKFEVEKRAKGFDAVFSKVLEYLRVKVFEGKEELAESLLKERDALEGNMGAGIDLAIAEDLALYPSNIADRFCMEGTENLSNTCGHKSDRAPEKPCIGISGDMEAHQSKKPRTVGTKEPKPSEHKDPIERLQRHIPMNSGTMEDVKAGKGMFPPLPVNTPSGRIEEPAFELELSDSQRSQSFDMHAGKRMEGRPGRRFVEITSRDGIDDAFSCNLFDKTMTFGQSHSTITFKGRELVCINRIGKGGYSSVYSVLYGGEVYALKQIRAEDQESLNICLDEIGLLRKLSNCEFVIRMMDYEVKGDAVSILLEYGETDLQKLIQSGPMNIFYIKYIWESILNILVFVHANRIVHRDIKPANFVLVKGKVRIIDFGISRSIRGDTTSILNFEKAGTLNYISPEQCSGGKVSRSSDVWAAGCILYHMIYRKNIHNGKNVMDILRMMAEEAEIEYGEADGHAIETMKACLVYNPKKRARPEELLRFRFLGK